MIRISLRRHPHLAGIAAAGLLLLLLTALADPAQNQGSEPSGRGGIWSGLDEASLREDYVEAFEAAVDRLRELADTRGMQDPDTLDALHRTALVAHLGGDQDMAEEMVEAALRAKERVLGPRDPRTIESRILRGLVAKYANDIKHAELCYAQALADLSPRTSHLPLVADVLVGRAHAVRVDHGAPDMVVALLRQALQLRRRAGERTGLGLADNLVWLGWSLLNEGRSLESRAVLDEAEVVLRSSGLEHHSLMGTALTCQADLCVLRGDWLEAERLYRRGLRLLETNRERYLPGFARRKLSLRGYDDLATVQLLRGRGQEAWRSLQKLRNNVSLDLASMSRWRETDPEGHSRVRSLYARLSSLEATAAAEPVSPPLASLVEKAALLAPLRSLERNYLAKHRPQDVDSEELRLRLPPRTAYIGWLHSRRDRLGRSSGRDGLDSAWIYVIRRDAPLRWIPLWKAGSPDERRWLEAHNLCHSRYQGASEWPLRVASDPELDRAAYDVWAGWLAPALPYLDGVDRLIVEYSGEFPRVPLESLPDESGRLVGDRFACTYVPSATTYVWLLDGASRPPLQQRPALALGGAVFASRADDAAQPRPETTVLDPVLLRKALGGDPEALDRLPMLPYSLEEARTVASRFPGSRLLAGREASEQRLGELARSGLLARFGVIHLATHMLSECYPERSAFALSRLGLEGAGAGDGLLRSREVLASWDLDADLLVLSGCQSARSCNWDEGEYVGFTQALMAVGAKSVVASLWKVDDRATALLMKRFYENLTGTREIGGMPAGGPLRKDLALAEAKRWLRDFETPDGGRPYLHPVYWAGFVLFGPGD